MYQRVPVKDVLAPTNHKNWTMKSERDARLDVLTARHKMTGHFGQQHQTIRGTSYVFLIH